MAEAVTNITRHSGAERAHIRLDRTGDTVSLHIYDDGRGGASETGGTGLAGIRRRVEAHDGIFELDGPPGGPTNIRIELPCG